jgi:RNA polymerase sigma factor (sigma-70 family)
LDEAYDSQLSYPVSPPALRRYRAERLLRKDFHALRSKVLAVVRSQLRAKGATLDPIDLDACYAQAWQGLYAKVLGGEQVESPSAWLVLVTFRRAIDEVRSAGRAHAGGHAYASALELDAVTDGGYVRSEPDMADTLDERARLRQVFEGLRTRLSEREREAASLCYLQGLSRAEAAARMQISQARMRKLMEGAGRGRPGVAGKVGELLDTISAGGWCEQQSSLMRAYAFGVLDPAGERHELAVAHCRECPACRAYVASLRGLASVLPPLPLSLVLGRARAHAGGTTTGARAGVGAGGSVSGGATGVGWSGLAGSLALKLAVTGLVALGAGYALLGGGAHGTPAPRHPVSRPAPRSAASPAKSPHVSRAPLRGRGPSVRHPSRRSSDSVDGVHARGAPTGIEFGPERTRPPRQSAPARTTGASGEFGFE